MNRPASGDAAPNDAGPNDDAAARKPKMQVGALCLDPATGHVLLITSRGTGRWIIPKGWPMPNLSLSASALQEAWEEAGVQGVIGPREIGRYRYDKHRRLRPSVAVEVRVFPLAVTRLANTYPEAAQRARIWLPPTEAAGRVAEPELQALLAALPLQPSGGLPDDMDRL